MGEGETVSFISNSTFIPNQVGENQAVKLASQLTYGMSENNAIRFLKRNGLTEDMPKIGDSFHWSDGFSLSNGHTLGLVIEPKTLQPNGDWIHGLLKEAAIYHPDGKTVLIAIRNAPAR
jgi:hypothetical protein